MKKFHFVFTIPLALFLNGCFGKPNPYPKNPNYGIEKPKKIYASPSKENLKKIVPKLQGKPYVWAEEGPHTFDCSGLTYYMYGSMGLDIPRVAREQAKKGKRVSSRNLKYGDLLFFDTEPKRQGRITHVGMYLGNGWFTHASTKKKEVIYSNLNNSNYYKSRLKVCRRYLPETQPFRFTRNNTNFKNRVTLPNTKKRLTQHYIQVLSFKGSVHKIKPMLSKLKKQGLTYKTISKDQSNKLVVGPFKNTKEVQKFLPLIRNNINQKAFPTRFKS
jgi:hypothetical protein